MPVLAPPSPLQALVRRRRVPLLLQVLGWTAALFFPFLCLLLMEYMNYAGQWEALAGLWEKHSGSVLFSCCVVWLLYLPNVTTPYWYVTGELTSYVSHYRQAGYTTLALHPYDTKFYSRSSAYPLLGFDAFYGQDEIGALAELSWKRNYISDQTVSQAIQTLADGSQEPVFLFAITMENHQPYAALDPSEISIQVEAPALSQESLTALTTYTQGLYDADRMLGEGWTMDS